MSIRVAAGLVLVGYVVHTQSPQHGVREFKQSGTFEAPAGVSSVLVELWGAGGGGAGGATAGIRQGSGAAGGGGGSGAYVRRVIAVTAGQTYVVSLGVGGVGGRGQGDGVRQAEAGGRGGDSSIQLAMTTLLVAHGGQGGTAPSGRAGRGGVGGSAESENQSMLVRSGNAGADGDIGGMLDDLLMQSLGGAGGQPILGTIVPAGSFGGAGGNGGLFGERVARGAAGGAGAAIVTW